jgi:hypothetical protein
VSLSLKRRIKALEKANGVGDGTLGRRYLEWAWGSREGPAPSGGEAADRILLRWLMELEDD